MVGNAHHAYLLLDLASRWWLSAGNGGTTVVYTRKDYLARKCSHREFYAQVVNPSVIAHVVTGIGEKELLAAADDLNRIDLRRWDRLNVIVPMNADVWRQMLEWEAPGFPWSKSDNVCIAKEAARQWIAQRRGAKQ